MTPERMRLLFRREYLAARQCEPSMGGRAVDGFHQVVMGTAEAQREDPEALYLRHLRTYLAQKLTKAALRAPYAFFAAAWGELADKGPDVPDERPDGKASKVDREERIAELRAEMGVVEGNLTVARVNGLRGAERDAERKLGEMRAAIRQLKGVG